MSSLLLFVFLSFTRISLQSQTKSLHMSSVHHRFIAHPFAYCILRNNLRSKTNNLIHLIRKCVYQSVVGNTEAKIKTKTGYILYRMCCKYNTARNIIIYYMRYIVIYLQFNHLYSDLPNCLVVIEAVIFSTWIHRYTRKSSLVFAPTLIVTRLYISYFLVSNANRCGTIISCFPSFVCRTLN